MSSSTPTALFSLARSKLNSGVKESSSLHRWVLLKNSIVSALPLTLTMPAAAPQQPQAQASSSTLSSPSSSTYSDDEEQDAFMFPDAGGFLDCAATYDEDSSNEAQWLDSVLEGLDDDDDDEEDDDDDFSSVLDSHMLDSLPSSLASSDDLSIEAYYLPPIYPPYHPPLVHPSYQFPLYDDEDDVLPYQDGEDLAVDEMSVPEAIEDTSDDESDAPETPIHQSLMYGPIPRASHHSSRTHAALHPTSSDPIVYVDESDSHSYSPYDVVDPLPFAASPHQQSPHYDSPPYSTAAYQEC